MIGAPDQYRAFENLLVRMAPGVLRNVRTGEVRLTYVRRHLPNGNETRDAQTFFCATDALVAFSKWCAQQPDKWAYTLADE